VVNWLGAYETLDVILLTVHNACTNSSQSHLITTNNLRLVYGAVTTCKKTL